MMPTELSYYCAPMGRQAMTCPIILGSSSDYKPLFMVCVCICAFLCYEKNSKYCYFFLMDGVGLSGQENFQLASCLCCTTYPFLLLAQLTHLITHLCLSRLLSLIDFSPCTPRLQLVLLKNKANVAKRGSSVKHESDWGLPGSRDKSLAL
jgi:hypothetical protein